MKKNTSLLLFQSLLSVISGILITQMSFLGRIGIHTMYRQFMVFRSWWKTALLFFFIQCLLFGVLYTIRSIVSLAIAKKIAWLHVDLKNTNADENVNIQTIALMKKFDACVMVSKFAKDNKMTKFINMVPIYFIQKMSKYGISSHNSQILSLIFILSWHSIKRSYTTFLSVCTLFMIFMA